MPRFFFHVDDGDLDTDDVGTEFPDDEAARAEAVSAAGAILSDIGGEFLKTAEPWRMRVTDETGRLLLTLSFTADMPSDEIALPTHN